MFIATVAEANDCVVVTDNQQDFVGLSVKNSLRRDVSKLLLGAQN
jgi:hypothetical protein